MERVLLCLLIFQATSQMDLNYTNIVIENDKYTYFDNE